MIGCAGVVWWRSHQQGSPQEGEVSGVGVDPYHSFACKGGAPVLASSLTGKEVERGEWVQTARLKTRKADGFAPKMLMKDRTDFVSEVGQKGKKRVVGPRIYVLVVDRAGFEQDQRAMATQDGFGTAQRGIFVPFDVDLDKIEAQVCWPQIIDPGEGDGYLPGFAPALPV